MKPLPNRQQVRRLIYSIRDFSHADSALAFLFEEYDFDLNYSGTQLRKFSFIESTAIIAFCRPLVHAKNGTTLNLGLAEIKLQDEEQVLRDRLIEIRHRIVAHSAESDMHYRLSVLLPFDDRPDIPFPQLLLDDSLVLTQQELRDFQELVSKLIYRLSTYLFELARSNRSLLEEYVEPLPGSPRRV